MTEKTPKTPPIRLVIGTAGHIDHGKSSLVERLTGAHPSRLKEERERGMTIDIGYAEYAVSDELTAGIIDVPGHEKFIRNMVAGASGVDLVILVVAADDGVMPQTREHLQIMRLLGIERGFTVITKIDLVDEDMLELVRDDVAEYLGGTFLAGQPMIAVSNTTGEGIDDVHTTLAEMLRGIPTRQPSGVFRMPIQRSFAVEGFGTVVTGVPISGRVKIGDELDVLPAGRRARVRGLHVHHEKVETALAGHRTAINITDVRHREVGRGDVVAARGYFSAARMLEVRLEALDHLDFPVRNDIPIRFHAGTADVGGRLVLLDKKVLRPGESGIAQVKLEEPVVVAAGDRYIVRLASPMVTIGGGVVVGETRWNLKRFRDWLTENITEKEAHLGDERGYLEYVIRSQGTRFVATEEAARILKRSLAELRPHLDALRDAGRLVYSPKAKAWMHADMFAKAVDDASRALLELHDQDRLQAGFHPAAIAKQARLDPAVADAAVTAMIEKGRVTRLLGQIVRHAEFKGSLSNEDVKLVARIEAMHEEEFFQSPIFSEIVADLGKPVKKVRELIKYLIQLGILVPLSEDLCVHMKAAAHAEKLLVRRILSGGPMPSGEFKDIIGATRKYVIPLLERFDKKGVTRRDGNERTLAPGWERAVYATTLETDEPDEKEAG